VCVCVCLQCVHPVEFPASSGGTSDKTHPTYISEKYLRIYSQIK
jgi:hypothetical protein